MRRGGRKQYEYQLITLSSYSVTEAFLVSFSKQISTTNIMLADSFSQLLASPHDQIRQQNNGPGTNLWSESLVDDTCTDRSKNENFLFVHTTYFCVPFTSQKTQRLFAYRALAFSFMMEKHCIYSELRNQSLCTK